MSQPFADLVARQGTHNGVKALAVESPDQLVLVALRADDDLDYGKLARELGPTRPIGRVCAVQDQQASLVFPRLNQRRLITVF